MWFPYISTSLRPGPLLDFQNPSLNNKPFATSILFGIARDLPPASLDRSLPLLFSPTKVVLFAPPFSFVEGMCFFVVVFGFVFWWKGVLRRFLSSEKKNFFFGNPLALFSASPCSLSLSLGGRNAALLWKDVNLTLRCPVFSVMHVTCGCSMHERMKFFIFPMQIVLKF